MFLKATDDVSDRFFHRCCLSPTATASTRSWRVSVTSTSMTLCTGTSRWVSSGEYGRIFLCIHHMCSGDTVKVQSFVLFSCWQLQFVSISCEWMKNAFKEIDRTHTVTQTSRCDVQSIRGDERHPVLPSSPALFPYFSIHNSPSDCGPLPPLLPPPSPLAGIDESRPAAINSRSVGEMTASDDFPWSQAVQAPHPHLKQTLTPVTRLFDFNNAATQDGKLKPRFEHLENCSACRIFLLLARHRDQSPKL